MNDESEEKLPEVAPDRPPDAEYPWGVCPRCGHKSTFEPSQRQLPVTVSEQGRFGTPYESYQRHRVTTYMCRGCGQYTAVVEEKVGQETNVAGQVVYHWRGIHWWPPPGTGDLGDAIPEALREAYGEGARCVGANAPHGAAVMFRRTVEGIVRDKGSEDAIERLDSRDLVGALKIMAKDGALDRTLGEWAEEVHGLGNVGGHFDPLENVNAEQAGELAQLVRALLRYLYEEPDRMAKLRASRTPPQ